MIKRDKYLTQHFRAAELRCRCRRPECDAPEMDAYFMSKLEALRVLWNKPLRPTSGARCAHQNKLAGGAARSQHLLGRAADFWFEDSKDVVALMHMAESLGFTGIGRGKHLLHLDTRPGPLTTWVYRDL